MTVQMAKRRTGLVLLGAAVIPAVLSCPQGAFPLPVLMPASAAVASLPMLAPDPGWPSAGMTIAARAYSRGSLRAVPDGAGGAIAAWQDARKLPPASCNCRDVDDLYAQRVSPDGRALWGTDGLAVCTWTGLWGGADLLAGLFSPSPGGARRTGSALVFWYHSDGPVGTFVHSISPEGKLERGNDGATVYAAATGTRWKGRCAGGENGEIWLGLGGDRPEQLQIGECVVKHGVPVCATPVVLSVEGEVVTAMVVAGKKGRNIFVAVVYKPREGVLALRTVPLDRGSVTAHDPAAPIWEGKSDRTTFDCAPDGSGGLFVVWTAPESGTTGVFAQRLDGKGRPVWGAGVALGRTSAPVPVTALVHPASRSLAAAWVDDGKLFVVPVTGAGANGFSAIGNRQTSFGAGKPDGPVPGPTASEPLAIAKLRLAPGPVLGDRISPERRFIVVPLRKSWGAGWIEQEETGEAVTVAAFDRKGTVGPSTTVFRKAGVLADLEGLVPQPDGSLFVFWADSRVGGYPVTLCVRRLVGKGL